MQSISYMMCEIRVPLLNVQLFDMAIILSNFDLGLGVLNLQYCNVRFVYVL
jgi:hypothetical protein